MYTETCCLHASFWYSAGFEDWKKKNMGWENGENSVAKHVTISWWKTIRSVRHFILINHIIWIDGLCMIPTIYGRSGDGLLLLTNTMLIL